MPKQKKNKIILGITGNIGCGKTTVARMFKSADSLVIDADEIAHGLLRRPEIAKKIKFIFGSKILDGSGRIDRKKLAAKAFSSKPLLEKLNRIIHPKVIAKIKEVVRESDKKLIILDAALIIEAGLRNMVDKLLVVTAKKSQEISRASKRSGLKENEVVKRLKSQISQDKKLHFADFIIDNSGSIEKTRKQVLKLRRKLWKS